MIAMDLKSIWEMSVKRLYGLAKSDELTDAPLRQFQNWIARNYGEERIPIYWKMRRS